MGWQAAAWHPPCPCCPPGESQGMDPAAVIAAVSVPHAPQGCSLLPQTLLPQNRWGAQRTYSSRGAPPQPTAPCWRAGGPAGPMVHTRPSPVCNGNQLLGLLSPALPTGFTCRGREPQPEGQTAQTQAGHTQLVQSTWRGTRRGTPHSGRGRGCCCCWHKPSGPSPRLRTVAPLASPASQPRTRRPCPAARGAGVHRLRTRPQRASNILSVHPGNARTHAPSSYSHCSTQGRLAPGCMAAGLERQLLSAPGSSAAPLPNLASLGI